MRLQKKLLSAALCIVMVIANLPFTTLAAENEKEQRTVYLHAQGDNPSETTNVSTVFMGNTADIYVAVDNPNKGIFENGEHKEPQYDLNGYTVKIYFDPDYFDYSNPEKPIDYTVPDKNILPAESDETNVGDIPVEDVPQGSGYYEFRHGSGTKQINGKTYQTAYATIFFSGEYLPQKKDGQLWYNLCKLPLKPVKTGNTDVFIDISGTDEFTLELFAKNAADEFSQTFLYDVVNGGYHHIVIKDQQAPSAPEANPPAGSYTEKQLVTLTAQDGCQIFYTIDGTDPKTSGTAVEYTSPIEIERTTELKCFAKRTSDARESTTASYRYEIVPQAPYLFNRDKELIPNIYSEPEAFTVYVSDKDVFGLIEDDSEIFYTFSASLDAETLTVGTNPEIEWVKIDKTIQSIEIDKKRTVRLITKKMNEYSEVSWYDLGIKPQKVEASHPSGEYSEPIAVTLSSQTNGAQIFYTLDGSDPITNGIEYAGMPITITQDTTLRAAANYEGEWSEISSYWYVLTYYDEYGVQAYQPSGVYEGEASVTLTPNNADHTIQYSTDGGTTWEDYSEVLTFDKDTELIAKAVDQDGKEGQKYLFTYLIKPLPPVFAPESIQFTTADQVTVYCAESRKENTERFALYYTTDGSDPVTSSTAIKAEENSDSVTIEVKQDMMISAVVKKDGSAYSSVVTHSYDVVNNKPAKPVVTLAPGYYTRKIDGDTGFETRFIPELSGTEIYYTVSYGGGFCADPIPNTEGTVKYDGTAIEIVGNTTIKAVAVDNGGVKSDVGIFTYIITPEPPKAAPSAKISGDKLPVVPVSTVRGSTVYYTINGFENQFLCEEGSFYLDTQTGNAYQDEDCTTSLGVENETALSSPAVLEIWAELDGVSCEPNRYQYQLSESQDELAPPFADKETGTYEEINIDGNNNFLVISLASINADDEIEYKIDNSDVWSRYEGEGIKLKKDAVLWLRSKKAENYSAVVRYVYHFLPLAPVITLPSGRYSATPAPTTTIELDERAPSDKNYTIRYRTNEDKEDYRYTGQEREIAKSMSLKAYVIDEDTGKVSPNTVHFYVVEADSSYGEIAIAAPYHVERISADVLGTGEYAEGIHFLPQNQAAEIHYFYRYTKTDGTTMTTNSLIYDEANPIIPGSFMEDITITAWLEDETGKVADSEKVFFIDFIHLKVPVTSLEAEGKLEFNKGTRYTLVNDYPNDNNVILYYSVDGSDPANGENGNRKVYSGEQLTLNGAVTVKAVYFSACGTCEACQNNHKAACRNGVYGKTGTYRYTVPTVQYTGGGGGGRVVVDNTRQYTKDIFGNEHPTHIGYIEGYPDGSVKAEGEITREEIAAILYRIKNKEYENPFVSTGDVFPDVLPGRWSLMEIEYMADRGIVFGYPDGEFKPERNLTRAEFAALIFRFAGMKYVEADNVFSDLNREHWAYEEIVALSEAGLLEGYEDQSFKPENNITRAEVMTVVNKILGRNPSESYLNTLDFHPFVDLEREKWYYAIVLEATVTHNYLLDEDGLEIEWEDYK